MPLEKQSLNNFLPDGFETNNLEGYKENFSADKIATGYEKDVKDRVSGPNFNNLLDVIGKNTNILTKFMDFIKNMPVNNLFAVDENNQLVYKNLDEVGGGGLEIGDIGIAPLGIDESKGKRRYLNGQIILQEPYQSFTAKLKEAIALYPSLACTESEWQTTATMTVSGQVGKFVVDDDAKTIRLPKIIMPIQGLTDLSKLAEIVSAGLPTHTHTRGDMNITGTIYYARDNVKAINGSLITGFSVNQSAESNQAGVSGSQSCLRSGSGTFDASKTWTGSTSTGNYSKSLASTNTVQQEQIQYPYFIQVATGAETEDNIINEIELNNPFFFGISQYFDVEPNNISWLKSNGQWKSKAIYTDYYDWILSNVNGGVEGFVLSTDTYTDYDFVLNTSDETFRLPLLDGSENIVDYNKGQTFAMSTDFRVPANGVINVAMNGYAGGEGAWYWTVNGGEKHVFGGNSGGVYPITVLVSQDDIFWVNGQSDAENNLWFYPYKGNGSLYFYVGETVQNANLINAGRIEEKINSLIPDNSSLISSYGMPSNKYIDLTLGASGSTYTAPANGWFVLSGNINYQNGTIILVNKVNQIRSHVRVPQANLDGGVCLPCRKNDVITIGYDGVLTVQYFRFIYAEGEV